MVDSPVERWSDASDGSSAPGAAEGERWRPPRWVEALGGYSWRLLAVAVAAALVLGMLLLVRAIVLALLLAILLSTLLVPVADWLRDRGARPALAAVGAILVLVAVGVGAALLVTHSVVAQWDEISPAIGEGADRLTTDGGEALGLDQGDTAALGSDLHELWSSVGDVLAAGAVPLVAVTAEVTATAALALFVLFFFLKDGRPMWAWVLARSPIDRRLAADIGQAAWSRLTSYLRGVAVVATIDATAIGLGLLLLGVPYVGAIAILTFFAAFIPTIGAVLAGAVAVLIALADGGWGTAFATLVVVVLVQQVESNLLQPVIVGRATKLHPLVVFLAITAGAILAGVLGMLLAVPLTAVAVTVTARLREAGVFAA